MVTSASVSVLVTSRGLWFLGEDLVAHLRAIELDAVERSVDCRVLGDYEGAAGFFAVSETARRVADGLVLTQLATLDRLGRR